MSGRCVYPYSDGPCGSREVGHTWELHSHEYAPPNTNAALVAGFLAEHERHESAPRVTCPDCQFERAAGGTCENCPSVDAPRWVPIEKSDLRSGDMAREVITCTWQGDAWGRGAPKWWQDGGSKTYERQEQG